MRKDWIIAFIIFCIGLFALIVSFPQGKDALEKIQVANGKPMPTQEVSRAEENTQKNEQREEPMKKEETGMPSMQIDVKKTYVAVMHTEKGDITIALNAKETPITVNNFVTLSRRGFYEGSPFHRTIKGFMIQGGDPTGTGRGGPGYKFDDEPFTGDYTRGTIAMANAGPDTNGSQFFIMHADYPLPKDYVIFGHVTSGIDIVDQIAQAPTQQGGEGSTPVNPVKITGIDITEE